MKNQPALAIPFHKPKIGEEEIQEVVDTLRSGWLTTGPKTKQFEVDFAKYIGVKHAVALNSATAALHLALEAIGLKRGDSVVVPTMTFAATAEVVRYFDARPIFADCREEDLNIDCDHARTQILKALSRGDKIRAIVPVHYGGKVAQMGKIKALSAEFNLAIIEDAAHCCPAFYREGADKAWVGVGTESAVSCFSFYANKCITTGEGGMACTNDDSLAERMRIMALHGISKDAWKRFTSEGSWYYEIIAPGFKYNLTDIAAAIGLHQLRQADRFRAERERVALSYGAKLREVEEIILPASSPDRIHSWHLFPIRLRSDCPLNRAEAITLLKKAGIGTSVHWMPLHLHPYYKETYALPETDFPNATRIYQELISLPIYPSLSEDNITLVCETLKQIIANCYAS